ncbi:MAG: actIII [Acidimicrobiales bacterium]|nr:actIII [Acidimicrobiales bacterium]
MDLQLRGKRALVTGGSRGIGRATARGFGFEGCAVALCARSGDELAIATSELARETGAKFVGIPCDTHDDDSIRAFVTAAAAELGGVDILVNAAARVGGTAPEDFDSVSDALLMGDFEEKAVGYFRCSRAVVPYMRNEGWGRIVNIAGLSARRPGSAMSTPARNAAVVAMTIAMANSLGRYGIGVNAVHPGRTMTESVGERLPEGTATTRFVSPDEVASVVIFLSSPPAAGISGEAIAVTRESA